MVKHITKIRGNAQLRANDLDAGNIKDGSITQSDLAAGTFNGDVFLDGSISAEKLSPVVTKQGNTFNGSGQLVKLLTDGRLPTLDGSNLFNVPGSGAVSTEDLTDVGGAINQANGLIRLDNNSKIPELDGSALINLPPVNMGTGDLNDVEGSVNSPGGLVKLTDYGRVSLPGGLKVDTQVELKAVPSPGTPSVGYGRLFVSELDGLLHFIDSAGVEIVLGAGSSNGFAFVDDEAPTGLVDGVNSTYTLASVPSQGSVKVYLNGIRQIAGGDFYLNGRTIEFLDPPLAGFSLRVDYRVDL